MTTPHPIGELLRSGVRPTAEETEHLQALGGFVAEMYGRLMGGRSDHLQSAADLWSGKLSSRLSAATGARWEQGLGLAEMLLGSELTSFWQIAREGFASGYDDFAAEMGVVSLYDDESAPPSVEPGAPAEPRRRRGSLFGRKSTGPASAKDSKRRSADEAGRRTLEHLTLAERDEAGVGERVSQRAHWADGTMAEAAVIRALAAGGLFVGDQVRSGATAPSKERKTEPNAKLAASLTDTARESAGATRSPAAVYLDGLKIDGRTPALASALARVDAVFGRTPLTVRQAEAAVAQSRFGALTSTAEHSIDRGLGSGERPVYGFYDAVETTYLNLLDERVTAEPDALVTSRTAGVRRAPTMPASGVAQRQLNARRYVVDNAQKADRVAASPEGREVEPSSAIVEMGAGRRSVARVSPSVATVALDQVVPAGRGLRPLVARARDGERVASGNLALASSVVHLPSGEVVVRTQRTAISAPRYAMIDAAPIHLGGDARLASTPSVGRFGEIFASAGVVPAALRSERTGVTATGVDVGPLGGTSDALRGLGQAGGATTGLRAGALGPVGTGEGIARGGVVEAAAANRGAGAVPQLSSTDEGRVLMSSLGGWRLAVDGGADLPVGATFSRHEVFAGGRAALNAADVRALRQDFRPVVAGEPGERRSELAEALQGMVWVTLPHEAAANAGVEDLGLSAVPSGRRAAMVPAGLAFASIAEAVAQSGRRGPAIAAEMAPASLAVVGGTTGGGVAAARPALGAAPATSGGIFERGAQLPGRTVGGTATQRIEGARELAAMSARPALVEHDVIGGASFMDALRSGFLGAVTAIRSTGGQDGAGLEGFVASQGAESFVSRWVGDALKSEPSQGLRAARFLSDAVAGGYGRIDSERTLLSIARESEAPSAAVAEAGVGGARRQKGLRLPGADVRGGVGDGAAASAVVRAGFQPARVMAGAVVPSVARGAADAASEAAVFGGHGNDVRARMSEARVALARAVMTARESRAVGTLFQGPAASTETSFGQSAAGDGFARAMRIVAERGVQAAGADEPVLGRLVQRMNALRGEQPLAARWEAPASIIERLAGLDPAERREVARAFSASGWNVPELQMLSLERAAAPVADTALADGAAPRSLVATRAAGERARGHVESARAARMSRSLARVLTGSESLGGPVDEKSVGLAAASVVQAQAASWLPLLASANADKYFGGLSPVTSGGRASSLRDVVGDLVKMAEAAVATSDSPVALATHREVLRRVAERQDAATSASAVRNPAVAGFERSMVIGRDAEALPASLAQRLSERASAVVGAERELVMSQPELSNAATIGAHAGGVERELRLREAERTMVGLEREAPVGLEARLAEALALATNGPAGARRMLRSTNAPRATEPAEPTRRAGRGRQVDEATLVRQTVEHGAAPTARAVRTGEAARREAAVREEMVRGPAIGLGSAMAPEAMLAGLRSPELTEAMRTVSQRQAMYGHDVVPVLTTIAGGGVDLDAARSSMSMSVQDERSARRGGLLRAARLAELAAAEGGGVVPARAGALGVIGAGAPVRGVGEREAFGAGPAMGAGGAMGRFSDARAAIAALGGSSFEQVMSAMAGTAPERELVAMARAEGIESFEGAVAAMNAMGRSPTGRKQRAGLLSAILRGTERAEMTAMLEQAGGREFAMSWLGRVDGSRSGLDIGMKETRQEFGKTFGGARRESTMASDSPIAGASLVQTGAAGGEDRSGLRSLAQSVVGSSTGAARPQHGASQAMRRTDWSFVQTGSKQSTAHADLGKLAAAIVGSSESSGRAPMPLVAPAAKAVAQTALRAAKTDSNNSSAAPGGGRPAAAGSRGPVDAKMSEKAVEMLAIEMANRVARLMGLTNERRGIWS